MKPFAKYILNLIKYFSHSAMWGNPSFDVVRVSGLNHKKYFYA